MGRGPLWSVAQRPLRVGPRVWVRASGCGARLGIRPNRRGEEDRGKDGRPPEGKCRGGGEAAGRDGGALGWSRRGGRSGSKGVPPARSGSRGHRSTSSGRRWARSWPLRPMASASSTTRDARGVASASARPMARDAAGTDWGGAVRRPRFECAPGVVATGERRRGKGRRGVEGAVGGAGARG